MRIDRMLIQKHICQYCSHLDEQLVSLVFRTNQLLRNN